MDEELFTKLIRDSEAKKKEIREQFAIRRYLFEKLKDPGNFYYGILGIRGIGKTVLLVQLANEFENSIYLTADSAIVRTEDLYKIIDYAKSKGLKNFFIDEIHKIINWDQDLKTLYDQGGINLFFSGSSAIELRKTAYDLSRRVLAFELKPLSFREFLIIKKGYTNLDQIKFEDLLDEEKKKKLILGTMRLNALIGEYFKFGGLAFSAKTQEDFYAAVQNLLDKIIHVDLEHLRSIDLNLETKIYKILEKIALSPAGETNYSNIAGEVELTKPTVMRIIEDLAKVGLIKIVLPCGTAIVRKEPKLYLAIPFREFFSQLFATKSDIGVLREEFFVNHLEKLCYLKGSRGEKTADFMFQSKVFEVGGKSKNFSQKPDFIVKSEPTLEEKTIPLYLFGFLC